MDDENVNKSRLFVASVAIIKQKYPPEIASVILDDMDTPAWTEAVEEASAVLGTLKLGELFDKVREVDKTVEAANKRVEELQKKYDNLVRDMESEVRVRTNRAVADREQFLKDEIRVLEDEIMQLDETIRNYKDGIFVKKTIKKFGPLYHKDYVYLEDDDFEEYYGDEAYKIGGY